MGVVDELLVVDAVDSDVDREAKALAVLGLADVHARADDGVARGLGLALLARDELERGQEARGVAHRKQLLRVLAVALAAERLRHREPERDPVVVVRLDLAVAALAGRSCMRGVLASRVSTCAEREDIVDHSP
jgi:hypothetical protein